MIDTTGLPLPANAPPPRSCIRIERPEPGLIVLVLDPPHRSLAVLDMPLLGDLDLALDDVERESDLRGLVITGRKPSSFAAGADIDALASLTDRALVLRVVDIGQKVFDRIARMTRERRGFCSVAAVGGPVPGGALELALACDFIVATDGRETRLGLPETQLGIVPAWGGSTRLPRRIGVPAALEAILSGKLHSTREALRIGLIDRSTQNENLLRVASDIALGREHVERAEHEPRRIFIDKNPLATGFIASKAREQVLQRTHGNYPAPIAAIDIVVHAPRRSDEESFAAEAQAASELAVGDVCKNLIHIFKLSEEAKKLKFAPDGQPARAMQRAGVLGAGVMGRGIASSLAEKGVWTRLYDIAGDALDFALLEHRADVLAKYKKRRLAGYEANAAIDRLDATRELTGFARAEIVIEAVAEKLEVKHAVFGGLIEQVASDTILATNTSSLSIDAIAQGLPNPERFVGLHFFNPVKRMPLVEIIRGSATDPRVVAQCAALALALGKTPVVVKDVAGFLVNRLLGPYLDESLRMFAGGVDPAKIDRALVDFGMPMGPLALLDEVGFDIAQHAAAALFAAYGERMTPSEVLATPIAEKRFGKKTGMGFYAHPPQSIDATKKKEKPALAGDLARFVPAGAPHCPPLSEPEIAERAVLAMINEAARALEEHVVGSAREIDLATVFGMGFPPFRGGLMRYADALGAKTIVERLARIAASPDVAARPGGRERFTPAASLAAYRMR